MKRKDVEKQLRDWGWYFLRHGGKHDIWTNGELETTIPRHREINELTARAIIRIAKENPK
ncbi:MAG: type II toxin-antitoxin system HicA family toxin [Planctomycetota bacterium]